MPRVYQYTSADIRWNLCPTTKKFLPLAKEAKKLAKALRKEQEAAQWVGIPPEKLLQQSFVEQLNAIQALDWLAPLYATKEHLLQDVITILELLGKADKIPFNQLYNFCNRLLY